MAALIDRIVAQFEARPLRSLDVPEWGSAGKALTVYFRTPSLATMSKISTEAKGDAIKQSAMVVAQCSLDGEGNRIFTNMDWLQLFRTGDAPVVQRIADGIMSEFTTIEKAPAQALDEAEKN